MVKIFELIRQIAPYDSSVLIIGESGTGKELIANAIHYNSPRASMAFIKVSCASLSEGIIESELSAMRRAPSPERSLPKGTI